jgi:hypothetical protein
LASARGRRRKQNIDVAKSVRRIGKTGDETFCLRDQTAGESITGDQPIPNIGIEIAATPAARMSAPLKPCDEISGRTTLIGRRVRQLVRL